MNDPLLLALFNQLRESGLPLGVSEYNLLLRAIDRGFGQRDRDDLAQLCRTLWIKSPAEKQIFQEHFDQMIPLQLWFQKELKAAESEEAEKKDKVSPSRVPAVVNNGINAASVSPVLSFPRLLVARFKSQLAQRLAYGLAVGLGLLISTVTVNRLFFDSQRLFSFFLSGSKPTAGCLNFARPSFIPIVAWENAETVEIRIVRAEGSEGTQSATLIIKDDRSTPGTIDDAPQKIFFQTGKTKDTVEISIVDDQNYNPNRTISVRLTDEDGGANIGNRQVILIILNDEIPSLNLFEIPSLNPLEIGISIVAVGICSFVVFRMRSLRKASILESASNAERTTPNLPQKALSSKVMQTMAGELASVHAGEVNQRRADERFPLSVKHLPITRRQMKQGWRHLRQHSREGPPSELDLEATVQQVSQQGSLLCPVLVPPRVNRVELLLLIDREGSMVPFHHLAQALVETAHRGGRFSRVSVYYFHNCPDDYLHQDPYQVNAMPIDECLAQLSETRTVCIIFSDGGAARGRSSARRRRMTKYFLRELAASVRNIAWLNPFPKERWGHTTAYDIAELVPMFELTHQDFYRAVDALRGRYSGHAGLRQGDKKIRDRRRSDLLTR